MHHFALLQQALNFRRPASSTVGAQRLPEDHCLDCLRRVRIQIRNRKSSLDVTLMVCFGMDFCSGLCYLVGLYHMDWVG